MRLLGPDDYVAMPWRNGGGMTSELACGPGWRISIATVDQSGPFSLFPGRERILTMLSGDGMELRIGGRDPVLIAAPLAPFVFDGACVTDCRLLGGGVRNFNVMFEPDALRLRVDVAERGTLSRSVLFAYAVSDARFAEGFSLPAGGSADFGYPSDCEVLDGTVLLVHSQPPLTTTAPNG